MKQKQQRWCHTYKQNIIEQKQSYHHADEKKKKTPTTHLVVAPVPSLVSVGVVSEIQVVDVRSEDVSGDLHRVEQLRVGEVLAEAADLVGDAVALRLVVAEVCFFVFVFSIFPTQQREDINY